ncbi:MAG: nucleotide exchange factor GrpE, partial [Sedimentisphaerales bacterium]|nr:nucleotide exchange factor GrpE [Sedimentisphaerales bacterium]
ARANDTGQLESLIRRMNDAVQGLQDLLEIPRRSNASLTRTTSLDRATATFQRLAAEVLDDQLGEILSPLIGLRAELSQYDDASGGVPEDFLPRWREILDHVLALAHLEAYEARVGERYDPLIHLAVGQTQREDLPEGVVAESCQPGYRSQRGRVLAPARVQINRR